MRGLSRAVSRWFCGGLIALAAVHATWGADTFALQQVQPGVFVHVGALEEWGPANQGDVANVGFIVGSRCVAVIDTGGTPVVGLALRAAIKRTTALPVCYVIFTHAHPDHLLGSAAFVGTGRPAPEFVASARYEHTLSAREPFYRNALQRDFDIALVPGEIVHPTLAVATTRDLDLGDRVLTLRSWPTAHTDNDLTVHDHRTRTLFTGDLLFDSHLPALDGSLRGWLAVMTDLARLDVATVVPGHGAVGTDWPGALDRQREYLDGLLRDTRAAIRQPLTIQQAIDRIPVSGNTPWRLTERFHRRNVTAAYVELEWEDDVSASGSSPSPSSLPSSSSAASAVLPARTGRTP